MLNFAIGPKAGFFEESGTSLLDTKPVGNLNRRSSYASTSAKNSTWFCSVDSAFPASGNQRSSYEWVVPSSATASFFAPADLIQAILDASDAALETSRERADSAVNSVLVSVYELDKAGFGRSAAQEVMLFVERNLRRNGLLETNRLLELADTSRLSSRSLIGLIRSTARLKDRLPAWKKAYLSSRKQVSNQGKNPDTLFVGLPKLIESDAAQEAR